MDMKISSAQIRLFKKGGFCSVRNEGVKHVKVLPYLSIVQSVEGSYDITLGNGETMQTGEGGFFVAPSGMQQTIVHHVNEAGGNMTARWIFLDVEINRSLSLDQTYRFPTVIRDGLKNELHRLFDRIFETDDIWQNYSDCYALIGQLLTCATPITSQAHGSIQRAVAYMHENYVQELGIGALARIANMSASNFYAAFQKQMNSSPIAYLNHYRLSIAADKLTDTTDTVGEIGYSVGIRDPLYFSKLFKKTYGLTPKAYRLTYRKL